MVYPTKYTRQYDFNSYQNSNPTRPLPGDKVNVDLDALKQSTSEIIDFLKGFTRSDGKLANNSVGVNQLDSSVRIGFSTPTTWEPRVSYAVGDTVFYANKFYIATVQHTSTDGFDESKWSEIVDFGAQATDAAVSAAAALASKVAAADAATTAAGSATSAAALAAAASDSAAAAAAASESATADSASAAVSATSAAESATSAGASAALAASALSNYESVAVAAGASPPAPMIFLRTAGYYVAGDGGEGLYERVVALGTDMVGFQSVGGAWWQLVPVNGALNVKACGAKGTWVSGAPNPFDDAPALRAAVAMAATAKLEVQVPSGKYYVNSTVSGAVLTVTDASLRMIGEGRNIVYPSTVEGSVFVLGPDILSTEDFLHFTGSATVRGTVLRGWGVALYSGVHGTAIGRYGVFVEATNDTYHLEYAEFSDLFIDNMGTASIAASAPTSNTGGSLCYSTIRDCQVMQMSLGALGDSVNIEHNVIGFNQSAGSDIGLYFYNISGAANTRIKHNVIAAQLGASVVCDGGTTPLIGENEFELHDFYPNGSGAIINLAGGVSQVLNASLWKNSISNNHVQNIIWNVVVGNAVGTEIDGGWSNILSTQPAGKAHISVSASASDTRILPGFFTVDGVSADPIISDSGTNTTIVKMRNKKIDFVGSLDTTDHITSGGVVAGKVYTVATLPTGLPAGARAFVSDSTVGTFTSVPTGGGSIFVPVFWNGVGWLIG